MRLLKTRYERNFHFDRIEDKRRKYIKRMYNMNKEKTKEKKKMEENENEKGKNKCRKSRHHNVDLKVLGSRYQNYEIVMIKNK